MRRWFIAALAVLLATVALARSEGIYNPSSNAVGDYQGIDSNAATGGGGIVGALLLEDGTSIILLEDGTSNLCLEGGC